MTLPLSHVNMSFTEEGPMVNILVSVLVLVLGLGLISFLIAKAPFLTAEYKQFGQYILLVIAVLIVLGMLTGTVPRFNWR